MSQLVTLESQFELTTETSAVVLDDALIKNGEIDWVDPNGFVDASTGATDEFGEEEEEEYEEEDAVDGEVDGDDDEYEYEYEYEDDDGEEGDDEEEYEYEDVEEGEEEDDEYEYEYEDCLLYTSDAADE